MADQPATSTTGATTRNAVCAAAVEAPSMWSSGYGMATDRFGVTWFVHVAAQG